VSAQSNLITENIEAYLKLHENKEMLRFITCGSVDDGKSSLIGRLLYDSKIILEDQLKEIEKDSKKFGTTGNKIDLALLVDGLSSEREQGITIDVAYRFFMTDYRKFIIADTPGHEQYTRNMVTGASTADLSIILIDARNGVLTQTKRHSYIAALLGIKNFIVAINKMDLVNFSEKIFNEIKNDYKKNIFSNLPNHRYISIDFIPISALDGDNIVNTSSRCTWYKDKTLIEILNTIKINHGEDNFFRFPVQYVSRPNLNFRGYSGTVVSGEINVGDEVMALPSKTSTVKSIVATDIIDLRPKDENEHVETVDKAFAPMATTITLNDQIDISRGDVLIKNNFLPNISNQVSANVVWMDETPMQLNNHYIFKLSTLLINGVFSSIEFLKDITTFKESKASQLKLNDIGKCNLIFDQHVSFDSYYKNRFTGSFIVIDQITNKTIGAGMILSGIINQNINNVTNRIYSDKDRELNEYVRKKYPEWGCKEI
jgi:sulfate adenylyltransferase subunit 1